MPESVRLTVQRQVHAEDIVEALRDAGALNVSLDKRSGDPGAAVDGYFYIGFEDPEGTETRRTAFGFVASRQEEHLDGWSRLQLGSDDEGRGYHFVAAVAQAMGGNVHDTRTGRTLEFEAEASAFAP